MLNNLKPVEGSRVSKTRKGRGIGSGLGKTSGKGHKGQTSRSGGGVRLGFEGGQNPLFRRLPKRGFHNGSHKEYAIVNISSLNSFKEGTIVDLTLLHEAGLVKKDYDGLKILGEGELTVKLTVKANKFSKTALESIEKVGGTAIVL